MARLQILELPEGASDDRAPFVLVVDESAPRRVVIGLDQASVGDFWQTVADRIGARGAIVTAETVEIPANDVADRYYRGEYPLSELPGQVPESQAKLSQSEALGHRLLQRAENAEGRSRALEVQRGRADYRAEQAEAGRIAADNVLRAVCEVFGGPHQDPVVKVRETLARAEQAEEKLEKFTKAQDQRDEHLMAQITDALGLDRLRDWDEIVRAARILRDNGHWFNEPGFVDPIRCARCGIAPGKVLMLQDRRTCAEVLAGNSDQDRSQAAPQRDCWWCKHRAHNAGECSERDGAESCTCGVADPPQEGQG